MTTKAETAVSEKEANKLALKAREKEIADKEKELNSSLSGKGLRWFVGLTRGRNPQMVQYQGFDESQPLTLPTSVNEFISLAGIPADNDGEKKVVGFLIDGYNSASFTEASDPVAEYVDASWPEDVQKAFRITIRQYSATAGVSIEDAVKLIKPGIAAGVAAKAANQ